MITPESWEARRSRVAALIASRDAVLDETAVAWVRFAREQGWSRGDLEGLWDGLTEDVVRRYVRDPAGHLAEVRREVLGTMAALRARIVDSLEREGDRA